jgi:signal transduction histidine kinase
MTDCYDFTTDAKMTQKGLQILLVDDSTLMRVHLTGSLNALDGVAEIRQASDVPSAIRLLQERAADVIILDIELPGQSGLELLKIVRNRDPLTTVIMISIHDLPTLRQKCADLGANYFFHKLTEFERVAEVCRELADRNERQQIREALAAAERRAALLQSANEELLAFTYSVSHDLHAPLRQIQAYVGRLETDAAPALSPENQGYLKNVTQVTRRMGGMIDALLAFARAGQSEMHKRDIDLGELAVEVMGEFHQETGGRNIEWSIKPLPVVKGDRALLKLVLVNLFSNALKFTRNRPEAEITIGCLPDREGDAAVFVKDNGAGFDPRYASRLFRVFERLHSQEEFPGTGAGLAIVRRIVSRHGGQTWAEGALGSGATFYFSIPK